mmetsp:Transcript_128529/g.240472  ORF Transcript_128529/g.240472 Transcript_128529/m.240472 type:complete len:164 (-) Transcript_128529:68-559(-)
MRNVGPAQKREWRFQDLVVPLDVKEKSAANKDGKRNLNEVAYLATRSFQDRQLLPKLTTAMNELVQESKSTGENISDEKFVEKVHDVAHAVLPREDFLKIFPPLAHEHKEGGKRGSVRRTLTRASMKLKNLPSLSTADTLEASSRNSMSRQVSSNASEHGSKD